MKKTILFLALQLFVLNIIFAQNHTKKANYLNVDSIEISPNEHQVMAVLWFQRSAEMRAMYYQGFYLAKLSLDNQLKKTKTKKKLAVVVDVDETLLDNSPYQAKLIENGESFTLEGWKNWTTLGIAKGLPGAADFLNYAKSKDVETVYITNRGTDEIIATAKNLIAENFPYVDDKHFFFKSNENSKNARRQEVMRDYEVLLYVGDNLTDFDDIFADRGADYGFGQVDENRAKFGDKFIMLPNPMYGEWEKAINNNSYKLSPKEKNKLRKKALIIGY